MKKFLSEFKTFITRGNVLDLAVGVIIGGAFQSIVNSLVNDIISPLLGLFGGLDFSQMTLNILGVEIRYGAFITSVISFLIMALVIFCLVKAVNSVLALGKKFEKKADEEPTEKECPYCFEKINVKATKCPHCASLLEAEITQTVGSDK